MLTLSSLNHRIYGCDEFNQIENDRCNDVSNVITGDRLLRKNY